LVNFGFGQMKKNLEIKKNIWEKLKFFFKNKKSFLYCGT